MKRLACTPRTALQNAAASLALAALVLALSGCGHMDAVKPPPATEFSLGPRPSSNQLYTATLQPRQPLVLRQLQTVAVVIADANGRPIDDAAIQVDGGMPEHGHGLPTQPRAGRSLGNGVYEIEGVRFSMGGWWELKLRIDSAGGSDNVTFNLKL